MTGHELLSYLLSLQARGVNLAHVTLNYRFDMDSDVAPICWVGEDLYDSATNHVLESIVFTTHNEDE